MLLRMFRFVLAAVLSLTLAPPVLAEGRAPIVPVPDRPVGDASSAPANTRYVDGLARTLRGEIAGRASLVAPSFSGTVTADAYIGGGSGMSVAPSLSATPGTLAWILGWLTGTTTVADLRTSMVASLFRRIETTGYAAFSDGGGGRYYWTPDTTTPDDGCAVIEARNGGRWRLDLSGPTSPKACGAKLDTSQDDTVPINRLIAAKAAVGGGVVQFPPYLAFKAGGIQLRTGVHVVGPGHGVGIWYCSASPCVTKVPGEQLLGTRLSEFRIFPAADALKTATIMALGTVSVSEFSWLVIEGFVTDASGATIMALGGEVADAAKMIDTNLGSNVTWNSIHDITVYGCGVCWIIKGSYGSTAPVNGDAPFPLAQVTTHNYFDRVNTFYVKTKCISIVSAADTNVWYGGLCNLIGKNVIGIANGDDPAYTGNTYVGANKWIGFGFSADLNATNPTLWYSQNYTSAIECIGCESDVDPARPGYVAVNMPKAKSYSLCGKRIDPIGNDWLGCQTRGIAWKQTFPVGGLSTGFAVTWPQGYDKLFLIGGGTLGSGTVSAPCNPPDNLRIVIATNALTVSSFSFVACSGQTQAVNGAPGMLSPGAPIAWRWVDDRQQWLRD